MTTATAERESIERIARCHSSFLHFLTEYVYINDPPPGGRGLTKWQPWPYLLPLARDLAGEWEVTGSGADMRIRQIAAPVRLLNWLKARQLGISWLVASYADWHAMYRPGTLGLLFSQGEDEAKELIRKAKFVHQHLPDDIRVRLTNDSSESMEFGDVGSALRAFPSTEKAGSGYTGSFVIADEHAKHPYAAANYATVEPTINAGGQFISVSTGWAAGQFFKQLYEGGKAGTNGFKTRFLSCFLRPGRDEAWYDETKRNFVGLPAEFAQEYPRTDTEAFSVVSGVPVFDLVSLQRLRDSVKEPIALDRFPLGVLKIWQHPVPGRRYVAGSDVSYGYETPDASVTQILDWQTGVHVASLWGHFPPEIFAEETVKACQRYNNALLGLEINGVGQFAIRRLESLQYRNVYYRDAEKAYANGEQPKEMGWATTSQTRPVLVAELGEAIRTGGLTTWDGDTISESETFVLDKGKAQAAEGCHDDRVMSLGIAWQMRRAIIPVLSGTRTQTRSFIQPR